MKILIDSKLQEGILQKITPKQLIQVLSTEIFNFQRPMQLNSTNQILVACYYAQNDLQNQQKNFRLFTYIIKSEFLQQGPQQYILNSIVSIFPNFPLKITSLIFQQQPTKEIFFKLLKKSCKNKNKKYLQKIIGDIIFKLIFQNNLSSHQFYEIQENMLSEIPKQSVYLLKYFFMYYSLFCKKDKSEQALVFQVYSLLQKVIQNNTYPKQILQESSLRKHIKLLFECVSQQKHKCYDLAIKMLQRLDGEKGKLFRELAGNLDCYGMHLVKDVWPKFYPFLALQQNCYLQKEDMLQAIFSILKNHDNCNVSRNCVIQMLSNPLSQSLFSLSIPKLYNNLISLLNLGSLYLDAPFHMDSSTQVLIRAFFSKHINNLSAPQSLCCLNGFLQSTAVTGKIDHAIVALVTVFNEVNGLSEGCGKQQIQHVYELFKSHYCRLPPRKKSALANGLLAYVNKNISLDITLHHLSKIIVILDQEYIQINLSSINALLGKFKTEQHLSFVDSIINTINHKSNKEQIQVNFIVDNCKFIELLNLLGSSEVINKYVSEYTSTLNQHRQSTLTTVRQRIEVLKLFSLTWLIIKKINQQILFSFIELVLNCVVFCIQMLKKQEFTVNERNILTEVVSRIADHCYQSQEQSKRVLIAKFMEFCFYQISDYLCAQNLICLFRARIFSLKKAEYFKRKRSLFLEDIIYNIDKEVIKAYPKLKCRILTLALTILFYDKKWAKANVLKFQDVLQTIDIYDYQRYQQVCWFLEKGITIQHEIVVKSIKMLQTSMTSNLGYSLKQKEIIALVQCSFAHLSANPAIREDIVTFLIHLLNVGKDYFIYQRVVAFNLIDKLQELLLSNSQQDYSSLSPLILQLTALQQYRGFDSQFHIDKYAQKFIWLKEYKTLLHPESDYQGTTLRLMMLTLTTKASLSQSSIGALFLNTFSLAIAQCLTPPKSQRMFLCGKQNRRLRLWQFLLSFPLSFFKHNFSPPQMQTLLHKCISTLNFDSLNEVKYYSQLFLLRLLLQPISPDVIGSCLFSLSTMLGDLSNVNKSVSCMVITGLLLGYTSCPNDQAKERAYTAMLIFTCSSIAYLRGLAQYFCFRLVSAPTCTKYTQILKSNYLSDNEAAVLSSHLEELIPTIARQIRDWDAVTSIVKAVVNKNKDIVSNDYHIDQFKALGNKLLKEVKHADGFISRKEYWKINASTCHPSTPNPGEQTFQTKFDPCFQNQHMISKLNILSTANSPTLAAHLCRTSEIFGVSKLILPSPHTYDNQQFRNIAVTADKWLPIQTYQGPSNQRNNIIKVIIKHQLEGYSIYRLEQIPPKAQRMLLLIDQECKVNFMPKTNELDHKKHRHWSCHVRAAIQIWQNYKRSLK